MFWKGNRGRAMLTSGGNTKEDTNEGLILDTPLFDWSQERASQAAYMILQSLFASDGPGTKPYAAL